MSKNLLDKSYDEMAFGFMRGNKKSKKKNRIVQGLSFLLNLSDRVMNNRVNKNLNALRDEKVFDIANRNDKWVKLSKVIDTENNYRNNPNYFMGLATQDFNTQRPNFNPNENTEAGNYMNAEIKESAAAKLREHQKQLEGVDVDITKEQFMKPLEDYYKAKQEEIMDPANRSVIHKGLSFLGLGRKRQSENAEKIKDAEIRKAALGNNKLGYLQPPTFTEKDAIDLSPQKFKYNAGEAAEFVRELEGVPILLKNKVIAAIDSKKKYDEDDLNTLVFAHTGDYNEFDILIQDKLKAYDKAFLRQNNISEIPKEGNLHDLYMLNRRDIVNDVMGVKTGDSAKIERLINQREYFNEIGETEQVQLIDAQLERYRPADKLEVFRDSLLRDWFTRPEIFLTQQALYSQDKGLPGDYEPTQDEVRNWWLEQSLSSYKQVIVSSDKLIEEE